ncbi:MFS transporter [Actinacidiphila glaucinigra]|uniref:MFS transporter n=1 Tax=Actinacidiphila glaucinigra TaxID=235986 RepID=UPI0037C96129
MTRSTAAVKRATFVAILVSEFLNLLGAGMASIAVTLTVTTRTAEASTLAVLLAVRTFTSIFFAPFAGVIVDRFHQRHVLLGANGVLTLTVTALFFIVRANHVNFVLIGVVFVVQALADSVAQSLIVSVVRHLANDVDLVRSNSLVYLVQSVPQILAPAIGAWTYAVSGPDIVLGTSLTGLLLSFSLMVVLARGLPVVERGPWQSPFAHVAAGFRFIWSHRGLRRLQLSYSALNFFNGLSAAGLVAYVTRHAGSVGWGSYSAFGGVGLVSGALYMTLRKRPHRADVILPVAQATAAVAGRILLAVPGAHWLWYLGSFGRNAGLQLTGGPMTAIWQRQSPGDALGVVSGCRRLISQGAYPVAVIIGGVSYDWWTTAVSSDGMFFTVLGVAELAAISLWLFGPVRAVFVAADTPVGEQRTGKTDAKAA